MIRTPLIVIFLLLTALFGQAQTSPKVVQVSGVVLASDSLYPAQFVGVFRSRDMRGTFSDLNGYFTLPVFVGDTLNFQCIGLKPNSFVVPPSTTENSISIVQLMESDTTTLPTVYILPYPAPHKLRQEVLSLDLPGDNYFAFSRYSGNYKPNDGMADFNSAAVRESISTLEARYNGGFKSGGNVLSPAAWTQFIQSMRRKKR